ncbi:Histidine kinase-, DNA gyrase B-, and HSP90-like ATPase [Desulfacinum hydrothermale DSM 13146]|uniref:histidine kinase n=2 Tax=Desulfacinum hydrothermale TaxID=109258 RepID=A0A1W1X4R9_9BACT|nr:Histidine kinase-, DNA gyrase B-, and HSP90-like ATPase [Desulfacinum hydrothermale DSM 13146]
MTSEFNAPVDQKAYDLACRLGNAHASVRKIAHEINNALTGVVTFSKILSRLVCQDPFPAHRIEDIRQDTAHLERAADRSAQLAKAFLRFSHRGPVRIRILDPLQTAIEAARNLVETRRAENIRILIREHNEPCLVYACPDRIRDALNYVIENALDAMPHGGTLTIEPLQAQEGRWIGVAVTDTGPGIPPEHADAVFEPFFSTKQPENGKGLGLGLFFARTIIEQHGGHLRIERCEAGGTRMAILLPEVKAGPSGTR